VEHTPSTAADDMSPVDALRPAPSQDLAPLTPAESHALRRSAPLTPTQFKSGRRLAEPEPVRCAVSDAPRSIDRWAVPETLNPLALWDIPVSGRDDLSREFD
jgi:hypothetical protein